MGWVRTRNISFPYTDGCVDCTFGRRSLQVGRNFYALFQTPTRCRLPAPPFMYCHRQRRNLPPFPLQVQVFEPYYTPQSNSQFYDLVGQDLRVSVLGAVRALVPLLRIHLRPFIAPAQFHPFEHLYLQNFQPSRLLVEQHLMKTHSWLSTVLCTSVPAVTSILFWGRKCGRHFMR